LVSVVACDKTAMCMRYTVARDHESSHA